MTLAGQTAGPNRPLHVCFVCNELPPATGGGLGQVVAHLARALRDAGHRVTILGCYERAYDWNLAGIEVRLVSPTNRGSVPGLRTSIRSRIHEQLLHLHHEHPIDIVEWPSYERVYLKPIQGVADVLRIHNAAPRFDLAHAPVGSYLKRNNYLHALAQIPNWIGVSQWILDHATALVSPAGKHTAAIFNPIDCELFNPAPLAQRQPWILFVGTLQEMKGAFALAEAARQFLADLPAAKLIYVGTDVTGEGQRIIREKCGAEVAARVEFRGHIPQNELADLMRQCSLLAQPGFIEAFGNVWAEAMASGIPVVGSTAGAGPEIAPGQQAGRLADPTRPDQIAQAVVEIMRSSELQEKLGRRGREIALERYQRNLCLRATVEFYRDCLKRPA